jgi:MFS family permease
MALASVSAAPEKRARKEGLFQKLGRKMGGDPALVHEGLIGGALGGIVAGIISGIIAGITKDGVLDEGAGAAVAAVLAGLFFGSIVGFGLGILTGAFVGVSARISSRRFKLKPRWAAVLGGTTAGAIVGAIIGNSPLLALVGAVLGCCGGLLWSLVSAWVESSMTESTRPAPTMDADSTFRQRHEILESGQDHSSYRSLRKGR